MFWETVVNSLPLSTIFSKFSWRGRELVWKFKHFSLFLSNFELNIEIKIKSEPLHTVKKPRMNLLLLNSDIELRGGGLVVHSRPFEMKIKYHHHFWCCLFGIVFCKYRLETVARLLHWSDHATNYLSWSYMWPW